MSDGKNIYPRPDNIRGLVQDLSEKLDTLAFEIRETTKFAGTRPADAKTFMLVARQPRGLTAIAKGLRVSRQAAHKSVQRLVAAGVVSFDYEGTSKRDMIATLTPSGMEARKVGKIVVDGVEATLVEKIGHDDIEELRRILVRLLDE